MTEPARAEAEPSVADENVPPLAIVAHEMRGLIAAVETCTAVFQQRLKKDGGVSPEAQQFFERILRNSKRMSRMIDDLVAANSSRGGLESLEKRPVDLTEIVVQTLSSLSPGTNVRFLDRPAGSAVILADEDRIAQVVSNLVRNGIEHGRGPVDVHLSPTPSGWTLTVENEGEIAPPLQERLFEPFVRGRTGGHGLGLGLHLVRRFVEAHGGSVVCTNQAGRIFFVVSLPK